MRAVFQNELFRALRGGAGKNMAALYALYCAGYLLTLMTVPFLGRTLGPAGWGALAVIQGLGSYLLVGIESGFALSATREIARCAGRREDSGRILGAVLAAKSILAAGAVLVALAAFGIVAPLQQHPKLFAAGVFWAVSQGMNMIWFYQGVERLRLAVAVDTAVKSIFVAAIFWTVSDPEDAWKVLALHAAGAFVSAVVLIGLAIRELRPGFPPARDVADALRSGMSMLIPRQGLPMYSAGNPFILGLFAPAPVVGLYAGAEKIAKAAFGLLGPASDALYPSLSRLARERTQFIGLARTSGAVIIGAGAMLGLVVYQLAPPLVRVGLGPGFEEAIPVLRILALLPPLVAANNVLTMYWMLPLGMDAVCTRIVAGAGGLNIALAALFAPWFAQTGVAYALVASQTAAVMASSILVMRAREDWVLVPVPRGLHANAAGPVERLT